MNDSDYRSDRLVAALLARQAHLRQILGRTDETKPRDGYGRAPFLVQGAERMRLQDELSHTGEVLAMAGV